VLATAAIGCGTDPARVSLVPVESSCGRPASPNQLAITAYAESGQETRAIGIDRAIDIGDFPFDTRQLGVEILVGGGVAGAIGKTLPLEYGELEGGTVIPIFMAPPNGRCAVGDMIGAHVTADRARG
jgi:hypothetical protein